MYILASASFFKQPVLICVLIFELRIFLPHFFMHLDIMYVY